MRINLNRKLRIALISVLVLSLCICSALVYKGIRYPKIIEEKTPIYNYTNKSNIEYTVSLKPNMLYDSMELGEGDIYISNYVNYINSGFSFDFNGERISDISGDYGIVAVMEGYIKNDEKTVTIWKKPFTILPKSDFTIKERSVSIKKDIPIKLEDYNSFAAQVIEDTGVNVDVKLTVSMNVNLISETDKGIIEEKAAPSLVIPLNVDFFEISMMQLEEKNGAIEETKKVIDPKNDELLDIQWYFIMGLLGVLMLLIFFTKEAPISNLYIKSVRKILKQHGNRVAAINKEITVSDINNYNIKSFDDLLKIADEIGKPIFYSYSTDLGDIRYFYVFDDLRTYILDFKAAVNESELQSSGKHKIGRKNDIENKKAKFSIKPSSGKDKKMSE